MKFYESKANVERYIEFTPAHDGALLVDALCEYLPEGSTVLELGLGPGKDFKQLQQCYQVTGSDFSRMFLELYREKDPAADLLHLDARTLATERHFDAIFSNKVLIHLSPDELRQSFTRQHQVLNDAGLILHSFWYGQGEQDFNDLTMYSYNESELSALLADQFEILVLQRHAKMAEGDSIYVIARKKAA